MKPLTSYNCFETSAPGRDIIDDYPLLLEDGELYNNLYL